jgi:hypothetical protein
MVVKDVYTGGVRTFLDSKDAHLFRKMLYAQVGQVDSVCACVRVRRSGGDGWGRGSGGRRWVGGVQLCTEGYWS